MLMQHDNFYRYVGNTGIKVSILGLGTVKLGRNTNVRYPHSFTIPNDKEALNLLSKAQELGVNLLDTAPAYGSSEARLGKLLKHTRNKWILCSKAGESFHNGVSSFDFSKAGITSSIKQSLRNLNTEYLDILLIHSDGNDVNIINECAVFSTLDALKQQGLIRAYGMSTKTLAGGILAVKHADIAMITYNPAYRDEYAIILEAAKLNKGILIKKTLASGHLDKIGGAFPVMDAFKFILRQQAVSSIIVGTINLEHLEYNCKVASEVVNAI